MHLPVAVGIKMHTHLLQLGSTALKAPEKGPEQADALNLASHAASIRMLLDVSG